MRVGIFCLFAILLSFQGCFFFSDRLPSGASVDERRTATSESTYEGVKAAGTYADPKSWSEPTFIGAIHKGDNGFYEARFNGSACPGCYYPPAGSDNKWWFFRGTNSGLYSNPKHWSETTYAGAIHKGGNGFYEARFNGPACSTCYYPPAGSDNKWWLFRGTNSGLYSNPKHWSEITYVGAIHKGGNGFYEARFNGSACSACYYPPAGSDNKWWLFRGAHAGTFNDPKSWREFSYVGAIHGRGKTKRFISKFNGVAQSTHYYPTSERENAWWYTAASGCSTGREPLTLQDDLVRPVKVPPGRFLDIQSLLSEAPVAQSSPLLKGIRSPMLKLRSVYKDYQVGSVNLTKDNGSFGALVVALRDDGSFVAFLDTPENRGTIIGRASGEQTWIKEEKYDYLTPDTIEAQAEINDSSSLVSKSDVGLLVDHDCNGRIIVDVLAGFSRSAAFQVRDPTAFALGQIESANLGLRNSRADTVRLRLVDTQFVPQEYPINPTTLGLLADIFKDGMRESGADMLAGYFHASTGNTAVGLAYAPGRYSIQKVVSPATFRHEIGHNVGGAHCNTEGVDNYRFGFANITSGTFLCGNTVNYYSTTLVRDGNNRPLGDARTANMTRLWGERAAAMSSYAKSVTAPVGVYP